MFENFYIIIDIIISAVYYKYLYNTECPIDLYLCTIFCPHCLGKLSGEIFVYKLYIAYLMKTTVHGIKFSLLLLILFNRLA